MANQERSDSAEDELVQDESNEEVDDESQDETDEDEQETDDSEADEETDDQDDEDESDDEDDTFTKRFTQFQGDTLDEYTKNLEDGYTESSKEAVRLSKENRGLRETVSRITKYVADHPELASAIAGQDSDGDGIMQTGQQTGDEQINPALAWAQSEMNQRWSQEFDEFVEAHPELETDPKLAQDVERTLGQLRKVIWDSEARQLGMKEGLEMAYKVLGKDVADKREKVAVAAKSSASQSKASSTQKPKQGKAKFTDAQIQVYMDMSGVDRNEAIKQLSEYNK